MRRLRRAPVVALVVLSVGAASGLSAVAQVPPLEAPPVTSGPTGYGTYRDLAALPELASGVRTLQSSSYDRTGGNDDGFIGTHSCLRVDETGCVIAEHTGAGEIASMWFTRDLGDVTATGGVTVVLDGETVLDAPLQDVVDGELGAPFEYPLVANADQSSGGVYVKVPMPFQRSMRVTTEENPLFHHVTYRAFDSAAGVRAFTPGDPAPDVLAILRRAGTADPKAPQPGAATVTGSAQDLGPGSTASLVSASGPGAVSELRLRIPALDGATGRAALTEDVLSNARLRISFDGTRTVDAPVGEFFGSGLGEHEVRSLMFVMDPDGWYTAWWPMPFAATVQVELYNGSFHAIPLAEAALTTAPSERWAGALARGEAGYFHADARRGLTRLAEDWVFLDTPGRGKFLGTSATMETLSLVDLAGTPGIAGTPLNPRAYLEGDERVFVDGAGEPQVHGTGTEDFYEGGWYFNRGPFTNPQNGATAYESGRPDCPISCDSTYRIMLVDAIPFTSSMRFATEHGSGNNLLARYGTVAFSYRTLSG